jgi:DNA-directed RNA polymerase subunit RPC12/RpoP
MSKKTVFMDSGSEDDYISYSDEEPTCTVGNQACNQACNQSRNFEEGDFEDYEIKQEPVKPSNPSVQKIKNKDRSLSIDSESSDTTKKPNYKCGSCKKSFILEKSQNMIRCSHCGYRILYKLRTKNYISYKTE